MYVCACVNCNLNFTIIHLYCPLSVWSNTDNLYDDWPRHWSGSIAAFSGMISIDGKPYR